MNQIIEFMTPRLVGKRFKEHAIPLEILKDFAVLDEMIKEAAKWFYLQEHKERLRVPKGFTDTISIKLLDIEEGSTKLKFVLVLSSALTGLFPSENQNCYERARDSIISVVDAAEHDEKAADSLPSNFLVYFDRLGRSLSDDEYIELRPENLQRPARLNKTTRKKLLLSLPQVQEYSEEIEIKGLIPEIDQEKKTFLFALSNGTRIAAPFDSIYREEILKAFNAYEAGQKVLIKGIGRFNRTEKLQRLESVEDISLIDALDIAERLEELSRLEDGWMDGKGKAPEKKDLEWLDETFDLNYDTALPLPRLFPTAEGGIQAEWSIGSWEITLEFDLPKRRGTVQAVNLATAAELNQEYDLSDENSWKSINEIIKNCREGIA